MGGSCLTFLIEEAPAIISTPTYIAIAAAGFALVALAALLAFLLKKSKSNDDILLHGKDPFTSGAVVENPIHVPDTQVIHNPLFNTAGGGDKEL
jgi:hypothetical protein